MERELNTADSERTGETDMKKRGRSTKVEGWSTTGSVEKIEDLLSKGKRKDRETEGGTEMGEEEEIFKRSRKVVRSSEKLVIGKLEIETLLKEMREGLRKDMEEGIKKIGREMEERREELLRQLSELRDSWDRERVELLSRIDVLEKKMEKWEIKERELVEVAGKQEERKEMDKKIWELLIKMDKKEREKRRKNVIVKGIKIKGDGVKEAIEEIWEKIGVKEKVEEIRRISKGGREGRGIVLVRMEVVEGERKVMRAKRELKGRPERIEDDMTVEERRAKWKVEREAERERREGKRVQIGYMRMGVNNKLRRWDEVEEKWIEKQGNE